MSRSVEALDTLRNELDAMAARMQVDDACMGHLSKLYGLIWIEACYDPDSDKSQDFARKLLPHMQALNDKFRFKR